MFAADDLAVATSATQVYASVDGGNKWRAISKERPEAQERQDSADW